MAEITVLLPVYNGGAYLEETLQSLRNQSFTDFEVLCIDDCSSDDSAQILQRWAADDRRFIYLNTGDNLGSAAKAVNHAAPTASGNWFVYSSQDDLFSKDWLEKLYARALASGADAVLPDVIFYHADGTKDRTITGYYNDRTAIVSGKEAFVASLDWSISGNALWRMSFLKERGLKISGPLPTNIQCAVSSWIVARSRSVTGCSITGRIIRPRLPSDLAPACWTFPTRLGAFGN